jgi:hypothetical protein
MQIDSGYRDASPLEKIDMDIASERQSLAMWTKDHEPITGPIRQRIAELQKLRAELV